MRSLWPFFAAVVPVGLLLVAFVYGYPRVFPNIERDHVDRYRERIAELDAAGKHLRAARFAAHAAERRQHDPDAWHALAVAREAMGDGDGAVEAAMRAVGIGQTMTGIATERPRYHAGARLLLSQYAQQRGDWASAVGHLELGVRFCQWPAGEVAMHYERLGQPVRAAFVRGDVPDSGDAPAEWAELSGIRQHRPWEPCQLRTVRIGLHDDGRVDARWMWSRGGVALGLEAIPSRMNEVPMEILARLDDGTALGDDAPVTLPVVIPGWRTTEHLWHAGSRLALGDGAVGPVIVLERSGDAGNALINTLPVRVEGAMLVAVRVRAEGAPASIAWLAEDTRERESFRDTFEPVRPGEWTWRAAYHPVSHHWEATWLQVGIFEGVGRIEIDRVVMLTLPEPPCGP